MHFTDSLIIRLIMYFHVVVRHPLINLFTTALKLNFFIRKLGVVLRERRPATFVEPRVAFAAHCCFEARSSRP